MVFANKKQQNTGEVPRHPLKKAKYTGRPIFFNTFALKQKTWVNIPAVVWVYFTRLTTFFHLFLTKKTKDNVCNRLLLDFFSERRGGGEGKTAIFSVLFCFLSVFARNPQIEHISTPGTANNSRVPLHTRVASTRLTPPLTGVAPDTTNPDAKVFFYRTENDPVFLRKAKISTMGFKESKQSIKKKKIRTENGVHHRRPMGLFVRLSVFFLVRLSLSLCDTKGTAVLHRKGTAVLYRNAPRKDLRRKIVHENDRSSYHRTDNGGKNKQTLIVTCPEPRRFGCGCDSCGAHPIMYTT